MILVVQDCVPGGCNGVGWEIGGMLRCFWEYTHVK